MKRTYFGLIISGVLLTALNVVLAGGGRIDIQNNTGDGVTGSHGIYLQAWVRTPDRTRVSSGEKGEFRIKSPRLGDNCTTTRSITDENGLLLGQCFATEPGTISIYVYLPQKDESSSEYLLHFYKPVATPTPTITRTPTPSPRPPQTPTPTNLQTPTAVVVPTTQVISEPRSSDTFFEAFGNWLYERWQSFVSLFK